MREFDDHLKAALRKEIHFQLPQNFSDKIINMILARARRERRWELVGIIAAGLLFIVALAVTLLYTDFKFSFGALTFLSEHKGLFSFGLFFILLLQLLDKKVIRKQQVS